MRLRFVFLYVAFVFFGGSLEASSFLAPARLCCYLTQKLRCPVLLPEAGRVLARSRNPRLQDPHFRLQDPHPRELGDETLHEFRFEPPYDVDWYSVRRTSNICQTTLEHTESLKHLIPPGSEIVGLIPGELPEVGSLIVGNPIRGILSSILLERICPHEGWHENSLLKAEFFEEICVPRRSLPGLRDIGE